LNTLASGSPRGPFGQLVQHESLSALALYHEFSVRLILDVFPRLLSYLVFKEPRHEWGLPARGTPKDSTTCKHRS